jgi:glycosyltransferase involved in cell wall biosynthesis
MRVVMLLRNSHTHDTRVEKEARTLREAGYEVCVVAHARPDLPVREVRDGIAIRRVARPAARIPLLRFALHARALRRAVEAEQPRIVHAHDSDALGPAAAAARRLGVPLVHDAHELWLGRPARGRGWLYRLAYRAWYRHVERHDLPFASAIVTVSAPIRDFLERSYGLRGIELVPNYPDVDPGALPLRRDLHALASLPATTPVVLYLGGILPGRGLEELVDAIALLRSPAHLVLLGWGGLAASLQDRAAGRGIASRVHILPPVPSDEVIAYAADASIGVSPIPPSSLNYSLSLPNKVFQYMAAGIPVVASDFPQVREVVEGSGAGRCVDTRRPESIAVAIDGILADRAAAAAMAAAGREAIRERYNWGVAARVLLATYERVLAG